jgi:phosphoribosylformylglycinamidine (FGAM) synthase-like enzyme
LYLVGETKNELGGSHFALVHNLTGGEAPTLDPKNAKRTFVSLHAAIDSGLVRACHDLSEGGLAVALAEMAFAGGYGASVDVKAIWETTVALFSESNTRFVCEVVPENAARFEQTLSGVPLAKIGSVSTGDRLEIAVGGQVAIDSDLRTLKEAWQAPFRW